MAHAHRSCRSAQKFLQCRARGTDTRFTTRARPNARLGISGETIRMLQHYWQAAEDQAAARQTGVGQSRATSGPNGSWRGAIDWAAHILADISLTEALDLPTGERRGEMAQAFTCDGGGQLAKWPAELYAGTSTRAASKAIRLKVLLRSAAGGLSKSTSAPVSRSGRRCSSCNCGGVVRRRRP